MEIIWWEINGYYFESEWKSVTVSTLPLALLGQRTDKLNLTKKQKNLLGKRQCQENEKENLRLVENTCERHSW